MQTVLHGQTGPTDIIFIGYELYNEGFYHHDKARKHLNWRKLSVYFLSIIVVFMTQVYFIHHIVMDNAENIRNITNVDHIEDSDLEVHKMYIYTKDEARIPSVLHSYKEEEDEDFERKFNNKTCDP